MIFSELKILKEISQYCDKYIVCIKDNFYEDKTHIYLIEEYLDNYKKYPLGYYASQKNYIEDSFKYLQQNEYFQIGIVIYNILVNKHPKDFYIIKDFYYTNYEYEYDPNKNVIDILLEGTNINLN